MAEAVERLHAYVALNTAPEPAPPTELVLAKGRVAETLVVASQQATLVVVGPGRREFGALEPGSVGHQVVEHADAPVAVVRPARGTAPGRRPADAGQEPGR